MSLALGFLVSYDAENNLWLSLRHDDAHTPYYRGSIRCRL